MTGCAAVQTAPLRELSLILNEMVFTIRWYVPPPVLPQSRHSEGKSNEAFDFDLRGDARS
jgi:hypothetical protein